MQRTCEGCSGSVIYNPFMSGNSQQRRQLKREVERLVKKLVKASQPSMELQKPTKWRAQVGLIAILLSAGGSLIGYFYWPAVLLLCVGLLLAFYDALRFPFGLTVQKLLASGAIVVLIAGMSVFVLLPAQLTFRAVAIPSDNLIGPTMAESPWKNNHYETRLDITNESAWSDYSGLDVLMRATDPIIEVIQIDGPPVTFIKDGREGYRVRCADFPRASTIRVMVATANFNRGPGIPDQLLGVRRPPDEMLFFGEFKARLRPYSVNRTIRVIRP
jgi:hypothetical protein